VKLTTHLQLVPRSKNEWNYTPTPQYSSMAWCSVKAQGQLHLLHLLAYFIRYINSRQVFVSKYTELKTLVLLFTQSLLDRPVDLETRLRAGHPCSSPGGGNDGFFSLQHRVQTGSGAHPASHQMGTGDLTPGVKWLSREPGHSI
jgi:hypothetical protein